MREFTPIIPFYVDNELSVPSYTSINYIVKKTKHTGKFSTFAVFCNHLLFHKTMKKIFVLLTLTLCLSISGFTQTNIVFNGNSLASYLNQSVTFNQTLHVCGTSSHYLFLSYERLRDPEETTIYGTSAYYQDSTRCANGIISAYVPNIQTDTIRCGSTITNLTAKVNGDRSIIVNSAFRLDNNRRPYTIPNMGDARLIICATNLEYYCPEWQGTHGASSDAEFQTQNAKILNALTNINADIFALIEVQEGKNALIQLVDGLNARTAPNRYAYINDGNAQTSTYVKIGFVYRTDKVTPVLPLGRPYTSNSAYYRREYVQAFTENSTGQRFVLSLNHFKAKDGTGSASTNAARMDNVEHLIDFLTQKINANYYQDPDFLILGDLNSSTMEEPIRYIRDHGFENQLMRFSPTEYSYVYDQKVEYLDHVFATSSMATQITNAAPYHLNADESTHYYYPSGDVSMYRYSDHDPIIVGVKLTQNVGIPDQAEQINQHQVYGQDGRIIIHNEQISEVAIYDITGKVICHGHFQDHSIPVATGIYIVKTGNLVQKVWVGNF